MTKYNIISADSHIVDPPYLWPDRLPTKYRDQAPHLVKDAEGGDAWELFRGAAPAPLGLVSNPGATAKATGTLDWYGHTYDSIMAGAFDGKARIDEQDQDGIAAEVIFPWPRMMGSFVAQDDPGYQVAAIDVYNDWLRNEFMSADPSRLIGMAQIPAIGIEAAIERLRWAKGAGFRGVVLGGYPSGNNHLTESDDAFWAAAEEVQLPIHIHGSIPYWRERSATSAQPSKRATASAPRLTDLLEDIGSAASWIAAFIYEGVFDRFPNLRMVAAEVGAGWVPHFLAHLDDNWWRNRSWSLPKLDHQPSHYFRRNWSITFIREPFTIQARHYIGVDNLLFSTDYPHHRDDWPTTRRLVDDMMSNVPEPERTAMLSENSKRLYRIGDERPQEER